MFKEGQHFDGEAIEVGCFKSMHQHRKTNSRGTDNDKQEATHEGVSGEMDHRGPDALLVLLAVVLGLLLVLILVLVKIELTKQMI